MGIVNQASAQAINRIARQVIALDPQATTELQAFAGHSLRLHIEDLNLNYWFIFDARGLRVTHQHQGSPNAQISGKLTAFLSATKTDDLKAASFDDDLHFSGKIALVRQFEQFIKRLQPDWEEPIARLFGDAAGYQLARSLRTSFAWFRGFTESLADDLSEYLLDELQLTPGAYEQQDYQTQVKQIRGQFDLLQARVERLKRA